MLTASTRRTLLFVLVAFLVAAALHGVSPWVVDRDGLYHFRHAALYAERGPLLAEFPWAAYSVISQERADLWYGFHLLLAPLTRLAGPLVGLEIAGVTVLGLSLVLFYWSLRRLEVGWPEAWPFLLLLCAPPAVLRMLALRPHVLSLGLLALLFSLLVRGRLRYLFAGALVLAWVHLNVAWIGLGLAVLVLGARSALERRLHWQPFAAVVAGLALGWLLRPNPLGAARLLWTQLVLLAQVRAEGVPLLWGGEFSPRPAAEVVTLFWVLLLLLGGAIAAWAAQRKRPRPLSAADRAALLSAAIVAVAAGVQTFTQAARWSDPWKLFTVLFAALALDRWCLRQPQDGAHPQAGRQRWTALTALLLLQCAALLQLALPAGRRMVTSGFEPERLRPHAGWLASHSEPGSIVFHARWETFAELFFWNTRNRYINGMDPIFLYARTTARYWEAHHLATGASAFTFAGREPSRLGVDSTLAVLRRDFDARFLLVEAEQRDLLYYARHEPRLRLVFEDPAASLFELQEAETRSNSRKPSVR